MVIASENDSWDTLQHFSWVCQLFPHGEPLLLEVREGS